MKHLALLFIVVVTLLSCKKKKEDNPTPPSNEMNINYPAAFVVNGQTNSISVIDLNSNSVKGTITLSQMPDMSMGGGMMMSTGMSWPHHIYLSPDSSKLIVAAPGMDFSGGHSGGMSGMPGKFAVIDAVKGTILKVVSLPGMNHNAIYSPDGTEIWTSKMEDMGQALIYDANTYQLKQSIDVKKQPAEITFSADGSMVFVANGGSDTVSLINPSNKSMMAQVAVGMDPVGAWPAHNGKMYVDNEMGMTVCEIDVMTMMVTDTIDLGFTPGMAMHNQYMNELWVSDADNGKVHYYTKSGNNWTHAGSFDTGAGCHAIAFSKDGMTAYTTNQMAGSVSVIDVMNHMETKEITVGTKPNGIVLRY